MAVTVIETVLTPIHMRTAGHALLNRFPRSGLRPSLSHPSHESRVRDALPRANYAYSASAGVSKS